jgi:hypothetical protein
MNNTIKPPINTINNIYENHVLSKHVAIRIEFNVVNISNKNPIERG